MKICPMGAELFHSDGRMDGQARRNEKVPLRKLAKALKPFN